MLTPARRKRLEAFLKVRKLGTTQQLRRQKKVRQIANQLTAQRRDQAIKDRRQRLSAGLPPTIKLVTAEEILP